ncbi:hypothetical protein BBJ28_00018371 [Nothophytophthora sp. Chile5]|nr:hypothetical protein BBJ28_00018371 [Nothophytophthora sp. Chile5]
MDTNSPEFREALRDHAKSLGVDLDAESYLLPLVQEALLAELPADWEQGETEDGTLYYFNPTTEESIWEHPLDAHYRELIKTKQKEHVEETPAVSTEPVAPAAAEPQEVESSVDTTTVKPAEVSTGVDVYSFDDSSDEDEPPPPAAPEKTAPTASKSRISDLFASPATSTPSDKAASSVVSPLTSTAAVVERSQTTPSPAGGFGFGRDRSWLLDGDDDVTPTTAKPTLTSMSTSFIKPDLAATTPVNVSSGGFGSRRLGASSISTATTTASSPSVTTAITDPFSQPTASSTAQASTQNSRLDSRRPGTISAAIKVPFFQDLPAQSVASTAAAAAPPSPTATAKLQQLEKKLADANSELERERAAHTETARQLQTAQQEAKESNYLKMKVSELKVKLVEQESAASVREKQQLGKLAEQENAASAREKQQLEKLAEQENAASAREKQQLAKLAEQESAASAREKRQLEKLAKLEAENARLAALQNQTQGHQQEAQQHRETLDSKQAELDALQKRLIEQLQQAEAASTAQEKARAALQEVLTQHEATAEAARRQHATEAAGLREQLTQMEQQLQALKVTADQQAAKCESLEGLQEKLAKQQKLAKEMEEAKSELQTQVDRAVRECEELKRRNAGTTEDLDAKRTEISSLQAALHKAQDELRAVNSSFEQQQQQQQLSLDRERFTAEAEAQTQARALKLQAQLSAQLDEQSAAKVKLQAEVLELRGELASMQVQELKPLEKQRDQLQREVERGLERVLALEKDLRSARQELATQTDRAHQLEIEVDVLVRREQQRKAQADTLNNAKNAAEKQLAALQDELLTAQHDRRIEADKLTFRVRELESQVTQKEYEGARLEERFTKAEAWRAKEAARVEKRDGQLIEMREQLTALQARHVEAEAGAAVQELRAAKQQSDLKVQQLERDLSEEREARKRDEIRRTEELQRMQQAVEWQLPQLAQACVTRSSDEWARKCRAVAKKLRDELNMRALQERNELMARERHAQEACERSEQKLKTAVAESEFLRREVHRLEDNNKVLLEQLHTIRVYLTQRSMPGHASGLRPPPWTWSGEGPTAPNQAAASAGGSANPLGAFSDYSTVNQLNAQLGVLHAQFQQLFDANEQRRRPPVSSFSPSDRFEIPSSPIARGTGTQRQGFSKEDQGREVELKRSEEEEDAEVQRLAMDALLDRTLAAGGSDRNAVGTLHRQQEELLTSLETLGAPPTPQWLPVFSPGSIAANAVLNSPVETGGGALGLEQQPSTTTWYQQDYWRSKYQ